jgi:hypothetical protein
MFALDGRRSIVSVAAQAVIDHCALNLKADDDDSLAITAYRVDPYDHNFYLTAYAGLRESEPMFGPLRKQTDYRIAPEGPSTSDPHGFRKREAIAWTYPIRQRSWHLYISGRKGVALAVTKQRQVATLIKYLEAILPSPPSLDPLFPELWHRERLIRDNLRDLIHDCEPGTSLEEIATKITQNINVAFGRLIEGGDVSIGIYLDTGNDWRLCGSTAMLPEVPERVEINESNAFSWVGSSTRPVLVGKPMSKCWRGRLEACGGRFVALLKNEDFSSLCLAPILYGPDRHKSIGILELVSRKKTLTPGHLFLLSRLSFAISGYLFSKYPLVGFPWWPEAKLRRGGARVTIGKRSGRDLTKTADSLLQVAVQVAADLMPTKSHVTLSPLRLGQSGAQLFRLDVQDEGGIAEVPRVLKMGSPEMIRKELITYYRYVHNKLLGADARIDVARSSVWPVTTSQQKWFDGKPPEAIVYTLVGADDEALPWSEWCPNVTIDELRRGIELLWDRVQPWYSRTRQAEASATIVDLMIEPLTRDKLPNYLRKGMKTKPEWEEVQAEINHLCNVHLATPTKTCVVHGDSHADNVFALLASMDSRSIKSIKRVALIDWANVRSGWHPLSDISKLMVDLAYRIRPTQELRELSHEIVEQWGSRLGCDPNDWIVALIHQIAKIMFYQSNPAGDSYISNDARLAAWQDFRRLCRSLKKRHSRGRAA